MGDSLVVTLSLANSGSEPVVVNARLAANTPHAPATSREVMFEVEGPAGQRLDFQAKIRIGPARPTDARVLEPGETIHQQYDLARFYDLGSPGSYRARALVESAALESQWVTFTRE